MIHKFPKLSPSTKQRLLLWLETEKHRVLADYHMYKACRNETEADKHKAYASCIESIKIRIKDHAEK